KVRALGLNFSVHSNLVTPVTIMSPRSGLGRVWLFALCYYNVIPSGFHCGCVKSIAPHFQIIKFSNHQIARASLPIFKSSHFQIFKSSNFQIIKSPELRSPFSNHQIAKFSNHQIAKFSNFSIVKS
ncbi:MAG TPA: hypothetical protein PLD36_08425, partial [Bacteroidia bacterium]|nr:hypothetical protein [Bacteroidia bacterium]